MNKYKYKTEIKNTLCLPEKVHIHLGVNYEQNLIFSELLF